jgi:long-chain acyl-CoA synthetase
MIEFVHPREVAQLFPDKPAAIVAGTGETRSYAALEARANQGARYFRSQDLGYGDCIAIWLPNMLDFLDIYWAGQRAGLYITPLSTHLTADEAAYILKDCSASMVILSAGVRSAADLLARQAALSLGALDIGEWRAAIADQAESPIADEQAGYHMEYSSGTTGKPKGIRISLTGGPPVAPLFLAERMRQRYAFSANSIYLRRRRSIIPHRWFFAPARSAWATPSPSSKNSNPKWYCGPSRPTASPSPRWYQPCSSACFAWRSKTEAAMTFPR